MKSCLIVLLCVISGYGQQQCPENEVYSDCKNCELNCGQNSYKDCSAVNCKSGCFCNPNEFRRFNGTCIPKNNCPKDRQCGFHEDYMDCRGCERGCGKKRATLCNKDCVGGCFCDPENFRRNATGACVQQWECPDGVYVIEEKPNSQSSEETNTDPEKPEGCPLANN